MKNLFLKTLAAAMAVGSLSAVAANAQRAVPNSQSEVRVRGSFLSVEHNGFGGQAATGEARFTIKDDRLSITVHAQRVPANIIHWQHFHGFTDARSSACPTGAADVNGDGIIDLIETAPMAEMTMVPFHDDPVSMEIPRATYPKASAKGALQYRKTVSLSTLQDAFGKAFPDQRLDLDRRVFMMHSVYPPLPRSPHPWPRSGPFPRIGSRCQSLAAGSRARNSDHLWRGLVDGSCALSG